jgi:hypothetical protein
VPVRTVNGNNLSHCMCVVRCALCAVLLCSGAQCSYSAVQVVSPLSWRPSAEHVVYSLRNLFLSLFTFQISKIRNQKSKIPNGLSRGVAFRISLVQVGRRTLPAWRVCLIEVVQ